jgi:hypothetical protein
MIYITVITTNQIRAPLRNGLMGSIPNIGYKSMMLRTFIPIIIIIETSALKKNVSGNSNHQTIARIIAEILQRNTHIMKMGIKLLGASFLSSVIGK